MQLRKKKTAERKRRLAGIDSFLGDIGKSAAEFGKERLRDYPKEVASGWKTALGMQKKNIPERLEGISPVAESVGGLSVSIPGALRQLGKSAARGRTKEVRKAARILRNNDIPIGDARAELAKRANSTSVPEPYYVRKVAADIRRSPEAMLDPLSSVKYHEFGNPYTLGSNFRGAPKASRMKLSTEAGTIPYFHEGTHGFSHGVRGERNLPGYYADVLETASAKGDAAVAKAKSAGKIKEERLFYQDSPIETHARAVPENLPLTGKISNEKYTKVFTDEAKKVIKDLREKSPRLYKKTLKDVAKSYKKEAAFKRYVKQGIQDKRAPGTFNEWFEGLKQGVKNPKSQDFLKGQNFSGKQAARIRKQVSRIAEDEGLGGKVLEGKLKKSLKGMKPIKLLTKKKLVD